MIERRCDCSWCWARRLFLTMLFVLIALALALHVGEDKPLLIDGAPAQGGGW